MALIFPSGAPTSPSFGSFVVHLASGKSSNVFSSCDPNGELASSLQDFREYFDFAVTTPVVALAESYVTSTKELSVTFKDVFDTHNTVLNASTASITLRAKDTSTPVASAKSDYDDLITSLTKKVIIPASATKFSKEVTVPVSGLTTQQLFEAMGTNILTSKPAIESSLRANKVYIVNGYYLKQGNLDLTCARLLYSLVGGSSCSNITPYLDRPTGSFTFIITQKKTLVFGKEFISCKVPEVELPTGNCNAKTEAVIQTETVLGINVSTYSVLATHSDLTRDDLSFYVFWNSEIYADATRQILMQTYGLTLDEITSTFINESLGRLSTCIINNHDQVLAFVCKYPADTDVLTFGPDAVSPSPLTDDIIDDILSKAASPDVLDPDITDIAGNILATLDLNKNFDCGTDLASVGDGYSGPAASGAATAVEAFDKATGVLDLIQGYLTTATNPLALALSLVKKYGADIENTGGSYMQCLYAGAGFNFSKPIPKEFLELLQKTLNFNQDKIFRTLDLFDGLLAGALTGFCLSASLLSNMLGISPTIGSADVFASNPAGLDALLSSGVSVPSANPISCASYQLSWPEDILKGLECLLKLIRMIMRVVRASLNFQRNLLATIQGLVLTFSLNVTKTTDTCNPAAVIGVMAAIEAQFLSLT